MGIFNLFNKRPSHGQIIQKLYDCCDKEMVDVVLPGGIEQLSNAILSIALICEIDLKKCDIGRYMDILKVFLATKIQMCKERNYSKPIRKSLQKQFSTLITNDEKARKIFVYVFLNMDNSNFSLSNSADIKQLDFYVMVQANKDENIEKNIGVENKHISDEDYGLVPTKPIYVAGSIGADEYLDNLIGFYGEKLLWDRIETIDIKGINGIVDVYEATTLTSDSYIKLYLNVYAAYSSTTIPKGLCDKKEFTKKMSEFTEVMDTQNSESNKIRSTLFRGQQFEVSDYGLNEQNPIVTSSLDETENYLARLRTLNKELLFWVKKGTMIVNDVYGISDVPVDVYQLYLNGDKYSKIYICSYGRDSSHAPHNLSLADMSFPGHSGNLEKEALAQDKPIELILKFQQLDYENQQLKKERKEREQKEHELKIKRVQEAILNAIKRYPVPYRKVFSSLLEEPIEITTICDYIHDEELFDKKTRKISDLGENIYGIEYFLDYLKSTIAPPPEELILPDEVSEAILKMEATAEQQNMVSQCLENEDIRLAYDRQLETFKKWAKQAEELKQEYPQFELQKEYMSEDFKIILDASDMKTAYEIIRFSDLYTLKNNEQSQTDTTDNFFCRKCGTSISGDSVFCYKCGTKVEMMK